MVTSFTTSISYVLVGIDGGEIPAGFDITSATGDISYNGSGLDYEALTDKFVVLRVQATSSRGNTTTTQDVTINILNVNEAPVFVGGTDSYNVNENTSGAIFTVNATDPEGSTVNYSLVAFPPAGFSINSATGVVSYTGAGLDYESQNIYTVTVRARSGGFIDKVFTVNVLDVNDAPIVSTVIPTQEIATAATATSFTIPSSTFSDDDGDTLYYSFTVTDDNNTDTSWLTFNASSGEFSVSDQSVAGIYNVTLTAADDVASTALTASTAFTLYVGVNVLSPEFKLNASYSFDLAENDTFAVLGNVRATVGNVAPTETISYEFISIDGAEVPAGFLIDSSTGAISYNGAGYNYESLTDVEKTIVLRVQATSSRGDTTATQDVIINIIDRDDAPVFTGTPYDFSIDEGVSGTTTDVFVGQITATDEDESSGALYYGIAGSAARALFNIDHSTGEITTRISTI